jgi:hypothetical protein
MLCIRLVISWGIAMGALLERLGQVGRVSVGFRLGNFLGDLHGHLREMCFGFCHFFGVGVDGPPPNKLAGAKLYG